MDYYTKYIAERPDWELVDVYTDEGISAVSTKRREGFKRMVQDALNGKIDLIITKSVSRFARNTVDSLETIRRLKEKGVECYFQKENIWSFDGKGELLITIMSSLAQEESRSISENVTWGQRKRFSDGKVTMPYKQFLGYKKGDDGLPQVVESEARIVRKIYSLYLNGTTVRDICRTLTASKVPTPAGKEVWAVSTVMSILQNEKYKGDALLQKTFTQDFLTKKMIKNEGQVAQYYVEDSHPAIVTSEMFDLVQAEITRNRERGKARSGASCFSDRVICGDCGEVYGPKTWGPDKESKKVVWQCNGKYRSRTTPKCRTPHLSAEQIQLAFTTAFNRVISDRESYIAALGPVMKRLSDTAALDREKRKLQEHAAGIFDRLQALIDENAREVQEQATYNNRYNELSGAYEATKTRIEATTAEKKSRRVQREKILAFIQILRAHDEPLTDFDEALWRATVESVTVYNENDLAVKFRDGCEIHVDIYLRKYARSR